MMPNVFPMGLDSDSSPMMAGGHQGSSTTKKKAGKETFTSQFSLNNGSTNGSKIVIQRSQITAENSLTQIAGSSETQSGKMNGRVVQKCYNRTGSATVDSE